MLISQTNTEPFNRGHDDLSVQYGLLTVDGLTFDGCRSGGMPLIQISDDNPTGKAETHFRNVKTMNWTDNSKAKALVNLGGGPRPTAEDGEGRADLPPRLVRRRPHAHGRQHALAGVQGERPTSSTPSRR